MNISAKSTGHQNLLGGDLAFSVYKGGFLHTANEKGRRGKGYFALIKKSTAFPCKGGSREGGENYQKYEGGAELAKRSTPPTGGLEKPRQKDWSRDIAHTVAIKERTKQGRVPHQEHF